LVTVMTMTMMSVVLMMPMKAQMYLLVVGGAACLL
jgi:hypothetical protein